MATKKKTAKTTNKQAVKKTAKKQAENKHVPTWNNVKGLMRVWASEWKLKHESYLTFSTSLGKKNDDDEYDNLYFDVIFKKGEAPDVEEGAFEIKVKKGFLTLKVYNDGSIHPAVMVMDYDLAVDEDEDEDEDEDLPF